MMESPSKYSVEQLLKARQDGVPDYIVVPMIQKAIAEKQASQNQQAMQQGAQKPPTVAQQVLSSAAQTMNKEKQLEGMPDIPTQDYSVTPRGMGKHPMADVQEEMGEEPEQMAAGGIAALRSGLPSEYAHGGIIAFANGTDEKGVRTNEDDYLELISPNADALRESNATAGYSVRDPKTGEMTNKHWKSLKDSLVAEHNLVSKHNGESLDQFGRTYYGHDKPKDKQDEYIKQLTEFTGLSPDTIINKDDPKLVKRVTGGLARKEQGYENLDEAAQDAILAGKPYRIKSRDGAPAAPAKGAPKGIASLVQRPEIGELDVSGYDKMMSKPEERDIDAQAALAQKRYGENPDLERRAKSYDEQETKLKGDDDKAMWKALMHAGIGMMSGKSPNFMSNLASGVTAGAEDYEKTREDIDAKKAHLAQLRDALGDARRQEKLAAIKHGEDSAQAAKASDKSVMLAKQLAQVQYAEHKLSAQSADYGHDIAAAKLPSEMEELKSKSKYYSTVNDGKEDIKTQQLFEADKKDFTTKVEKELEKSGLLFLPPDNPKVIKARAGIEAALAPYYPRLVEAGVIGKPAAAPAAASVIKPMPQVLSKPTVKGADFDYQWTPKG
jgi:hypothetical protein